MTKIALFLTLIFLSFSAKAETFNQLNQSCGRKLTGYYFAWDTTESTHIKDTTCYNQTLVNEIISVCPAIAEGINQYCETLKKSRTFYQMNLACGMKLTEYDGYNGGIKYSSCYDESQINDMTRLCPDYSESIINYCNAVKAKLDNRDPDLIEKICDMRQEIPKDQQLIREEMSNSAGVVDLNYLHDLGYRLHEAQKDLASSMKQWNKLYHAPFKQTYCKLFVY